MSGGSGTDGVSPFRKGLTIVIGLMVLDGYVLLALFRPQAGKEVPGFNFLYLIIFIYQEYRVYI